MRQDGIVDIAYTHAFYPELAPAHLAFALLARGYAPPVAAGRSFHYGELGCGQGLTTNMLAALHPHATFTAVDLLAAHMDGAKTLAMEAGNGNAAFHRESFAEFGRRAGADFDVIALHGVWTWVDSDNRRILKDIVARRLKPGGALFLSYNCLPAWAPDMPVRALLLEAVERAHGTLPERIGHALAWLRGLIGQDGYFRQVPSAAALVESLQSKAHGYLAHEYLNRHWSPFYSADVARGLADVGLEYAASATLLDHIDSWQMPVDALARVTAEADPILRETLRDTLGGRRFRRDIFVRQPRRLEPDERRGQLGALRFALTVPRAEVPETVSAPGGGQTLSRDLYAPVLDALAAGPCRLADLPGDFEAVVERLTVLAGLGVAAPSLEPGDAARCRRLNAAILRRNRASPAIRQLAAAELGTALVVDILDRLFLLAEAEGADPATFAWKVLSERGKRLRRGGEWLEGDDNLAELGRLHAAFLRERRPGLAVAGI